MDKDIRNLLIDIARRKQIIYYQELCDKCQLGLNMRENPSDRLEIGRLLGDISTYEFNNDRPLLSAVVITKGGEEGDGFYKLCQALGLTGDWKKLKREGIFAALEIKKCHEFWSNNENYESFK